MRVLYRFLTVCAAAVCSPSFAGAASNTSWGKADVPLDQYARDAAECTETSRYITTYINPERLKQLDSLSSAQLLDTVMQINGYDSHFNAMNIVSDISKLRSVDDIARRSNTFGAKFVSVVTFDVRDQLQAVIDRCLIERGYTKIRLTEPQLKILRTLKQHSPERTAYLHSIDSSATVVAQQRINSGS